MNIRSLGSLLILGAVLHLGTLAPVQAKWAWASAVDLATDSNLIVEATLTDLHEFTKNGTDFAVGHLRVASIIFGEVSTPRDLELRWENRSNVGCPRVNHSSMLHKQAIWLLNVGLDGSVTANYPRRAVALGDGTTVARFVEELRQAKGAQAQDARVVRLLRFMEVL